MPTIKSVFRNQLTYILFIAVGIFIFWSLPVPTHACTVTLFLGSKGPEVACLQQLLTLTGDYTYGEVTQYYGPVTQSAVQKFQTRKGIVTSGTPSTTGYGMAGLRTRHALLIEVVTMLQQKLKRPSGGSSGGGGSNNNNGDSSGDGDKKDPEPDSGELTINFSTQMRLSPSGASTKHYPAVWSATNKGSYTNKTGNDQVVKEVTVVVDSSKYEAGSAAMDFCLVLIPPGLGSEPRLRNGIETLCGQLIKSDTDPNWPRQQWKIAFPGQGLLLQNNHTFHCAAQGSLSNPDGREVLSDFSCTAKLATADVSADESPVQSLRTPYIDRRFSATGSGFHPHLNQSLNNSTVRSFWIFAGGHSVEREVCTYRKQDGIAWQNDCFDIDLKSSESRTSPYGFYDYTHRFNPGDQMAVNCQVDNHSSSSLNNCAFYLMVDVPIVGGKFVAFPINSTIASGQADKFCFDSPKDQYFITHPLYNQNRDSCRAALENFD